VGLWKCDALLVACAYDVGRFQGHGEGKI